MNSLATDYLGLALNGPIMASPSPMMQELDEVKRLEDAGCSAIGLHSLFEEQISLESSDLDAYLSDGADSFSEALSYFPKMQDFNLGPDAYLEHIRRCKDSVNIPVIGSLNGVSAGGWTRYAKSIEQAGADALELNIYFMPTDAAVDAAKVETMHIDLVRDVVKQVKIPVAVKLGPFFSAMPNITAKIVEAGAKGLVLFNRFYQPDIDLERLEVVANLELSDSSELRLRLRWTAILYGRIKADLGITGGVHTADDVLKCMMAGANVAMMTSAILKHGPNHVTKTLKDVRTWIDEHEYESIRQMRGSMSQQNVAEPAAFERANYMKVLRSYALKTR